MDLSTFLKSQKLILESEIKARSGFCLNSYQQIEVQIKYKILDEINRQIKEIESTGKLNF